MDRDILDKEDKIEYTSILTNLSDWKRATILKKINDTKLSINNEDVIEKLGATNNDIYTWVEIIFKYLNDNNIDTFSINDLEICKNQFLQSYIDEMDVMDKVINAVQLLYYNKLLQYDGNGNYKKLWVTKTNNRNKQSEKIKKYFCPQSYLESVSNGDSIEQRISILNKSDKTLFNILNKIEDNIFYLSDVYKYEDEFKKEYPGNNRVRQKLRQRLQCLRDIKLIEFIDNSGMYKKLW